MKKGRLDYEYNHSPIFAALKKKLNSYNMQLKGLVRFFAIALILICVYQLSFTLWVHNHESDMGEKADRWTKANFQTPEQKYPNSASDKVLYADSLKQITDSRKKHLLDSTADDKIGPFGFTTYKSAKDKELMLGLDLQGGMNVTLEVGMDGLIKSLADFTRDAAFNKALDIAVAKKANSGADLITLFVQEYKAANPSGSLAPFFITKSGTRIKYTSSEQEVVTYLQEQSKTAFANTLRIMRSRIDGFGVSSPNINPDPTKGIINIELAGVNDPVRVRNYLQSTANLQFFEVYNIADIGEKLVEADKKVQAYLSGVAADSSKKASDTASMKKNEKPFWKILQPVQAYQKNGKYTYPGAIGYIQTKDTATLNSYLSLEIVKSMMPSNLRFVYGKSSAGDDPKTRTILTLYAIKTLDNGQAELEGDHVKDAAQDYDGSNPVIRMNMDGPGTAIWGRMTTKAANENQKAIAIVLDNVVYSAPSVDEPITTGTSQIRGGFTVKEAQDLSEILQSGKLPAPARIVQEQIVGPTLGKAAVHGGALAFLISFLVIFALMLVYYNTAGWVANMALVLNLLFTVGILSSLSFTLTAAGIAGLVLTIGMAVDTNVIIFERIKEELTKGKSYHNAVTDGYKRSLAPVLDAHVTTFLTAAILFYFGLGPVLGFATTQMIGIVLSLFCGILVSRLITDFYTTKNRHFEYFTVVSKKIFRQASFKFIEYRKVAYGISVVVLLLGVGSFFNGFDQGVEFAGGRSYSIRFDKDVSKETEAIRDELKTVFAGEAPIIKTVGTAGNQLDITTAYKIKESGKNIDSTVEADLYIGLKSHLPQGLTYAEFDSKYKQGSQTVQPSISEDLKSGAEWATIISLLVICFYIFIRFRDWRYSLGTIVSLLHDVLVTLAVFSFARKFVPFPMEIDQHFIAAVLTVIGFSMNDTVIVFDRIREYSGTMRGADKGTIINKAINDTLSRTIMTSLTVFLTLLILFIFGGEVTRGFSFAMLIGVITGTYSSIFVAAPILVDFAKDKPLGKEEKK